MTRTALLLALSVALATPAMACGMYIPSRSLAGAFDAIDSEAEAERKAREATLAINWVEEVGEVPYGSLPKLDRHPQAIGNIVAHVPDEQTRPRTVTAERTLDPGPAVTAEPAPTERVRAALREWFKSGPGEEDLGDTGDTGS